MIRTVSADSFAEWLRQALHDTPDDLTGEPMTARRLASLIGISPEKVSTWMNRRRYPSSPEDVRRLSEVLNRPQWEILEAIGYNVAPLNLTDAQKRALVELDRFRDEPSLQEQAIRLIRALPEPRSPR